jgi:hypothetical protein
MSGNLYCLLCLACCSWKWIYDRQSVGQSVLVPGAHLAPVTNFFLLVISIRQLRLRYFAAPSLTRWRVCNLLYNCFWALSEQSLLGQSPAYLRAVFYCLIWDSPQPGEPGPRIYIPQEQGGPVIPPGTGFPFCRLLRLAGLRWRYSNPPPHRVAYCSNIIHRYRQKYSYSYEQKVSS